MRKRFRRVVDECDPDDGSASVVVLATALAWTLAMVVAVGPIVRHLADQQHAQSAADASALAAVIDGCDAANAIAAANQGALESCERTQTADGSGFVATVVVAVGATSATARASNGS